jgi:hypothetical protein
MMENQPLEMCGIDRCGYVIYGDPDQEDAEGKVEALMRNHLAQHEDPEGWKADSELTEEEV